MSEHIVFVRFFPFYTSSFPYARVLHHPDGEIESILLALRDEWWSHPANHDRFHRARIERLEQQLQFDAFAAGLDAHVLIGQPENRNGVDGALPAVGRVPTEETLPPGVRASFVRLQAAQCAAEGNPTSAPTFEQIANVAGWMQPPPPVGLPPPGLHLGTKVPSPAASPPDFRKQRVAAAAAPWATLPSLESFHPYRVSRRYPVALTENEHLAEAVAAALQARVVELAVGAQEAQDRDELEGLFLFANPRFFPVKGESLSRAELATSKEQIERLSGSVLGTPSSEERFVRAYWHQFRPTIAQVIRPPASLPQGEVQTATPHPRNQLAHSSEGKPRWDSATRTLTFGGRELKRYRKHPAPNQMAVLSAFEKQDWPPSINLPVRPDQIRDTVRALNKAIGKAAPFRFGADGTGKSICWEKTGP